MDRLSDYVHFALGNQTNSLIGLNTKAFSGEVMGTGSLEEQELRSDSIKTEWAAAAFAAMIAWTTGFPVN
jgi:hypothetical protein